MLELKNVCVTLSGAQILKSLSMTIPHGQTLALVGPSGSGKSTLLRAIAGLTPVACGTITLNGVDITDTPAHKRGIGMVFQDGQLFTHRSVGGNIAYGLENKRMSKGARKQRITEMLRLVQLDGLQKRSVTSLSGGQSQRIALARALAPDPQILLLDEPLSALDADLRRALGDQLRSILADKTAIFVTHDLAEAENIADKTVKIAQLQQ